MALLAGLAGCRPAEQEQAAVLRVANWGGPAVDPEFLQTEREIREGFERRHPGVRVQTESIPGEGQYLPKLMMMFVSGKAPDVIQLDASSAAVFINNDLVLDLTPLMQADRSFRLDNYFPNVAAIARRGDRLYAVPLDFTPVVMYYNKRLFDAAGVPYPQSGWTWADFLATAKALTVTEPGKSAPTQYGLCFTNWMPGWVPWIWLNGGDVLSPDGRHAEGYFNGPQTHAAIQFLIDLIRKHRVAPSLSESAAAGVDLFRAERAAMNVAGHWMLLDYRAAGLDIGVVALPSNTGKPETVIYASGLAISRATKHRDLAWEYVKYMTSAEAQKPVLALGVAISANREVARSFAGTEVEDAFLDEVAYARPPWGSRVERYELVEDLGREMMEDVLTGGVPVEEAVRRAAALVDADLRRR